MGLARDDPVRANRTPSSFIMSKGGRLLLNSTGQRVEVIRLARGCEEKGGDLESAGNNRSEKPGTSRAIIKIASIKMHQHVEPIQPWAVFTTEQYLPVQPSLPRRTTFARPSLLKAL